MKKSKNRKLLDIALLTAGRLDLFTKCIDALLPELDEEYQVHVCNNGTNSSQYEEQYRRLPPNTMIRRLQQNQGYSGGANTAINSGNAPFVLFVSDDIFLHPGAITNLLDTMSDPTIHMAGLKLLFPEDSTEASRPAGKVQHIGMGSTIRGDMVHPLIGWSPDHPKCCVSRDVLAVTGAAFMVRREAFRKAGGFNPIFGKGYYEDMDLCFQIRQQGGRIYVNTEATATHGVGQTFRNDKNPPPIQQNQMLFRSKWGSTMIWTDWEMW